MRADIEATIRALLAKAEATPFPEEASAFMAKAQELMARYAIDEAVLRDSMSANHRERPDVTCIRIKRGPMGSMTITLLAGLAQLNRCKLYTIRERRRGGWETAHVVGFEADRDVVEMLYYSLTLQLAAELAKPDHVQAARMFATDRWTGLVTGARVTAWRTTFARAFRNTILGRLEQVRKGVEAAAGHGVSLVLASAFAEVERAFDDLTQGMGKVAAPGAGLRGSRTAAIAGHRAGERADLGGQRLASGAARAIGAAS